MLDSRVSDAIRLQEQMQSDRAVFDAHWTEVAERALPRQDLFNRTWTDGSKRTDKIFDSTVMLALDRAASAIDSLITPSSQQYQVFEPEDDRLLEDRDTMLYCDALGKHMFRQRYKPFANFASQVHECFISLIAFGTQGLFTDEVPGMGTRYKSCALAELYIMENAAGVVDLVHRKFPLTARAAVNKWGDRAGAKVVAANQNNPTRKMDFLHCVRVNEDRIPRNATYRGMPFSSYYISMEDKTLIDVGGYRTMPYAVSRHVTSPREVYGRSPIMMVLPDVKMVNEMEKTIIRAAHKIVDPPLLLYGDGVLSAFSSRPNALNYGGVDEQGRQLVHPMKMGSNLPLALDMTNQKREVINDALFITLFQILVKNPQMTATEALIRAQEKGQLLAPTIGRQQTELLLPVTERELDIEFRSGRLPEMPQALMRSGGQIKIRHTSPLSRLRRAEDGVAIVRTLEQLTPLIQIEGNQVLDNFDEDAMARELSQINGVPGKIMRPMEVVQQMRDDRAKKAEEQRQLALAEQGAKTMQHLGKTTELIQPEGA